MVTSSAVDKVTARPRPSPPAAANRRFDRRWRALPDVTSALRIDDLVSAPRAKL